MNGQIAIYARLSPRPDGKYEGVDIQEAQGRRYAARTWPGVPVVVYADAGISAANGDHRPEFEHLREDVRRGDVAHVWAVEQSRLSRRESEWFALAAELDAAGITEVHTDRDGIVRVGDEIAGIKAVLAAAEVRKLKRRVNDRLDANAAAGTPSGATPFGYRPATAGGIKTYRVVEDEAAAIRWAAERALAGWSLAGIAAALSDGSWTGAAPQPMTGNHRVKVTDEDGNVVAIRRGALAGSSVRRMLTGPAVAGFRVHRGVIVGTGNWPAILDEATWRAVRSKLTAPRTVTRANGQAYPVTSAHAGSGRRYTLTGGLAVCGAVLSCVVATREEVICGAPMLAQHAQVKRGTDRAIYRCSRAACTGIAAEDAERHVADVLFAELAHTDLADRIAADDHAARRDEIGAELGAIDGKRRDLAAMWAAGDLSTDEWRVARDALTATERDLAAELASKPAPPARVAIEEARGSWDSMNLGERREFIRLFVERITVSKATPGMQRFDPSRIGITWKLAA